MTSLIAQRNVKKAAAPAGPVAEGSRPKEALPCSVAAPRLSTLGVDVCDVTLPTAAAMIERMIEDWHATRRARAIYFVNAHTLNLAYRNHRYRDLLNRAAVVFGDGTGVRWAARAQGIRLQDNVNGTDLMPHLFERSAGRGFRYFLLGADPPSIGRAAAYCQKRFAGWTQAGFHHGYVGPNDSRLLVERINASQADLLLVGMGNPLQEEWIDLHLNELSVPVCIGVGGLFDHWAGNLQRAPAWVRRRGCEWLQLLWQQPHKWRRYLLGNPQFLWRMLISRGSDQSRTHTMAAV